MCLYSSTKTPHIAEEDIKVYKLVKMDSKYLNFYAPFTCKPLTEVPLEDFENIDFDTDRSISYGVTIYRVIEGFIHVVSDKDSAEALLENFKKLYPYDFYFVVEGIIPKGTKYFTGCFTNEMCTKQVKFNKEQLKNFEKQALQMKAYLR